jgi:hypothetical protein
LPAFGATDVFATGAFVTTFTAARGAAFATALRADFAAAGFAFETGLDLETDFAADFFDEALAMASRRCMSEKAAALHHGCTLRCKRPAADIRRIDHGLFQIVSDSRKSRLLPLNL